MPLARLCGSDRKVRIAEEIRYEAVVRALSRGVSPLALDEKLVYCFFHAQPWIDGLRHDRSTRWTPRNS